MVASFSLVWESSLKPCGPPFRDDFTTVPNDTVEWLYMPLGAFMRHDLYYAGIGSRDTPEEILRLMVRLGRTLTDIGFSLASGDAKGADYAFYVGARLSPNFHNTRPRIYLSRDGYRGRWHDPSLGFIDAQRYPELFLEAQEMARKARGGWDGLNEWGIELHSRNVFQILGHTLKVPVKTVYLYAEPKSERNDTLKGGTNTAYQLAKSVGITRISNFYYSDAVANAEHWLLNNESDLPYPSDLMSIVYSRDGYNPVF